MASIEKRLRGDRRTVYRVKWRDGGGRDGAWRSQTFDTKTEASRFARDVEAAGERWPDWMVDTLALPSWPTQSTPLQEVADAYLATRHRIQPDTLATYRRQAARLSRYFRTLENVNEVTVAQWINAMRGISTPKTIANYHGLLSSVMSFAVKRGLRTSNSCHETQLPDRRRSGGRRWLTHTEFQLIQEYIHRDSRLLIDTAVGTGARWGELTALTVGDLDVEAAVPAIHINKAWKRSGDASSRINGQGRYVLGPPKSLRSTRSVSLPAPLVERLAEHAAGRGRDDLLFTAPRGGPLRQPDWYAGRWRPAVELAREELGLAKRPRFHDLRHSHAVWLIRTGTPLPIIQARLGHESIQITIDVYGAFLPTTHEGAFTLHHLAFCAPEKPVAEAGCTSSDRRSRDVARRPG